MNRFTVECFSSSLLHVSTRLKLNLLIFCFSVCFVACSKSDEAYTSDKDEGKFGSSLSSVGDTSDTARSSKYLDVAEQGLSDSNNIILILGDSLSAAYRMSASEGWVSLLAERLEANSSFSDYGVVNASISGATTAAGLSSLPSLLATHRPKIVVVELGANDGLQGKPIPYITKNLSSILSEVAANGAQALLLGNHIPPNYGKAYTKPFFDQYKTLAKKFDIPYVPFLLEGVATDSSLMMPDGLHPLPRAQTKVLENVWSELEKIL